MSQEKPNTRFSWSPDGIHMADTASHVLRVYEELARMARNPATLESAVDLLCMMGALAYVEQEDYFDYMDISVWTSEPRTTFYLTAPVATDSLFDRTVLRFLRDPTHAVLAPRYLDFFHKALDRGASISRLACGTLPALYRTATAVVNDDVASLCRLLRRFAEDESARPMLLDPELFRILSTRMTPTRHISDVVSIMDQCVTPHPHVFEAVVDRCGVLLAEAFASSCASFHAAEMHVALDLLERCASHPTWKPRLTDTVLELARYGWKPLFGPLLSAMLRGSSVEIVVRLHAAERLGALAIHVRKMRRSSRLPQVDAIAWRAVEGHLLRHWPRRMAAMLHVDDDGGHGECDADLDAGPTDESHGPIPVAPGDTAVCCPITLGPAVGPWWPRTGTRTIGTPSWSTWRGATGRVRRSPPP